MVTYQDVKTLVENKLILKTEDRTYEELSEYLFGEGNCFNESEVRKRMYGMKRLIEIIEADKHSADIANRILSISDVHYPFNKPLDIFKDYIGRVDTLQLNGDILDCFSISKYSKSYRVSPVEEMIGARQYIIDLIEIRDGYSRLVMTGTYLPERLVAYADMISEIRPVKEVK